MTLKISQKVLDCYNKCPDFLDIPTAWAIQETMNEQVEHHPNCSSVKGWYSMSGPHFLCDCDGVDKIFKLIQEQNDNKINTRRR